MDPRPHLAEPRVCQPEADKGLVRDGRRDRPDVLVARWAGEDWGVLSLDELRACGLSRQAVSVRVRNGRLHRMHRGVYAVGHASLPLEGRFLAAVKAAGPDAVLSHFSAAVLWGYVDWDGRYVEVTVPAPTTRRHRGVRVHTTHARDPRDVTRARGVPVTTPARTLVDLASVLDYRPLRRAVRQAQALHRTGVRRILEVQSRLGPRRGSRSLARILATGPAPTRSVLEDVVLDLVLRGGLEHPDVNVPLVVGGRRVVPDFRWSEEKLIVEADSATWHDGKVAREDDAERQALLEAAGERVIRVTWKQAVGAPTRTLARLRAAGAPDGDVEAHSSPLGRRDQRPSNPGFVTSRLTNAAFGETGHRR